MVSRRTLRATEFYLICVVLCSILLVLAALGSRVLALEEKPCLMSGAHTGCKRIDH